MKGTKLGKYEICARLGTADIAATTAGPAWWAPRAWLNDLDTKWTNPDQVNADTLGVFFKPLARGVCVFSTWGSWSWRQANAFESPIDEQSGAIFWIATNRNGLFASFEGVSIDRNEAAIRELDMTPEKTMRDIKIWSPARPVRRHGPVAEPTK